MPIRTDTKSKMRDACTTLPPVRMLTLCAVLTAVALVLSYLESLIPLPVPVPGVKLGFANIAVLSALYLLGGRGAFAVNIIRILLAGLMFTGFSAMLYALAGGILGVLVMILLKRTGLFSVFGVSVGGATAHIAGQLSLAVLVTHTVSIFMLLPALLISAVLSGLLIGFIAQLILRTPGLKRSVHEY
ncbi:MAG: Gx transporter family protein [Clostridiales Family XIII bacterium]|nr:Gx transporter family protein [Clostridiales Family XIII bacterium]